MTGPVPAHSEPTRPTTDAMLLHIPAVLTPADAPNFHQVTLTLGTGP